jgi:D-sedoheptulose 7-phosphate isomerase
MTSANLARRHLEELADLLRIVEDTLSDDIEAIAREVLGVLEKGGKLLFCGNGGSAADAQHLAAEYVVRFSDSREPLRALALTTDTSVLTAGANDFGFEKVFSRQVEALGAAGDLLFLHSTSGMSENLLQAARSARRMGLRSVAFLARGGGSLAGMVDRAVIVPTDSTARAQEVHLTMGHIICQMVEEGRKRREEGSA